MRRKWAWVAACAGSLLCASAADALEIRYRDQVNKVNAFDPHGVVARRLSSPNGAQLNRLKLYSPPPVHARYKDDVQPNWGALGNSRAVTPVRGGTPVRAETATRSAASVVLEAPVRGRGQDAEVRALTGGAVYRKLSEMANTVQ